MDMDWRLQVVMFSKYRVVLKNPQSAPPISWVFLNGWGAAAQGISQEACPYMSKSGALDLRNRIGSLLAQHWHDGWHSYHNQFDQLGKTEPVDY